MKNSIQRMIILIIILSTTGLVIEMCSLLLKTGGGN